MESYLIRHYIWELTKVFAPALFSGGVIICIAWVTNNTWKNKFRQEKEAELIKNFIFVLLEIEKFIDCGENNWNTKNAYKMLGKFKTDLSNILFEYQLITVENNQTNELINYFIKFSKKYLYPTVDETTLLGYKFDNIDEFWEDFTPIHSNEEDKIEYPAEYKEFKKYINLAKQDCKDKLIRLYNPKLLSIKK